MTHTPEPEYESLPTCPVCLEPDEAGIPCRCDRARVARAHDQEQYDSEQYEASLNEETN